MVGVMGNYIKSIDGLRAVAILLVLFFHAGFEWASGGFIGVDVFFVISGFLITRNIAKLLTDENWSFSKFYARRIARLLPALFTTIIVSYIAAYFILSPDDFARTGRSGIYAALSSSNIFFWIEAGYFDQSAHTKPFLHTWSLGVEEQFYLIWPLFMVGMYKWRGISGLIPGMAVLGIVSLAFATFINGSNPSAVFYLMPFRIYQFAIGGLIALGLTLKPGAMRSVVGFLAIASLIIISFFVTGDGNPLWRSAVAPAVAAGAFIWASETKAINTVFASYPLVWLGQRSYSVYLVHWPIIVLWSMATDYQLTGAERWIAIGLSIVAGATLYKLVETPFRFRNSMTEKRRGNSLMGAGALLIMVMFAGAHIWGFKGFTGRVPSELVAAASDVEALRGERGKLFRQFPCSHWKDGAITDYRFNRCAKPPDQRPAYFLIGDSFGDGVGAALRMAYADNYFGQYTVPGCVTALNNKRPNNNRPWCRKFMEHAFTVAEDSDDFTGIVFAADWRAKQHGDLNELIKWANNQGRRAIVFGYRIRFEERVATIAMSARSIQDAEIKAQARINTRNHDDVNNLSSRLRGDYVFVDMKKLQCPEDSCPIFTPDGDLIYFDKHHFTAKGVAWIAQRLQQEYPNLLENAS